MYRLRKYLKPYLAVVAVSIVFLFVQANANLALPDYMSQIVNNGIQQGGVENAVPEAISASTMDKLQIFMSVDDQSLVNENYTLVEPGSAEAEEHIDRYPILSDEAVYVLGDPDKETTTTLNTLMGKSFMIVSGIQQAIDDPESLQGTGIDMGFDLSQIPQGTDIFSMLKMMPAAQMEQLQSRFSETIDTLGDSMVTQIAVGAVKSEYGKIGLNTDRLLTRYLLRNGGIMLLISLIGGVATVVSGYLAAKVAAGVARDVRQDVFRKVENFSNAEFDTFSTASLITRSTNDVTQLQMVTFMMLRLVIFAPIMGIGGVIRALDKGASMSWIIVAAVLTLLSFVLIVFFIALPKFKIIQDLIDRLNLVTRESLSGMMVIRAFNKQDHEEQRFDKANLNLTSTSLFISRVMVTMFPFMMLVMNGLSLLIIWVGAHQVADGLMQVGDMMAFLQYTMQIVFSFLMMTMMFIFLPRAAVSGARIADVLETDFSIKDPEEPKQFSPDFHARVEFRDVGFRYPGAQENVICGISFTAQPGQTTAIIGSTGCGKSSVINLIPRFYDASEGEVLVDGINIRNVKQSDLRDKIGYVPQKGNLFSGTIESNLHYADENASEEELKEALAIAQATDFVFAKEDGMDTEIAQGGSNVSGGQKQRLSIARALVKKPPIYIFDDSFSALDFKTDTALRKALKERTTDSTVLIVTQRVATVKTADQIIVLDEGEIVGKGTHHELMETCQTYQEIARSQLSVEELS